MKLYYWICLLSFLNNSHSSAQVVINEISNTNVSTVYTPPVGETTDWIEIYNSGSSSVNLKNYYLKHNSFSNQNWYFPSYTIQPYSFLMIFASGKDTILSGLLHTSFKISNSDATITLYNANGQVSSVCNRPQNLQTNHSYGRSPDGGINWCYFNTPSPYGSNNSSTCYKGYESPPVFSLQGGFYTAAQTVNLTSTSTTSIIHYNLNSNVPSSTSNVYSGPINISSTTILSAQSVSSINLLPSEVVKNSYFFAENLKLPVVSITFDSLLLFDSTTGMYVTGPNASSIFPYFGANYWQDTEKPCYMEYFDKNNKKQFESNACLKIFGGYSRAFPQKSFKIKFRKSYGPNKIEYPILMEKGNIRTYSDIILRNGGSDYAGTHFRDAFMQRLMKNHHVDYMAYEPAVVFLNGQFWGFYEVRERQDENYIEENYGVGPENCDFLLHEGIIKTITGSDTGFYNMHNYITTASVVDPKYYENVSQMLDINNFMDYFIAQTYYGNKDWLINQVNNIKFWRRHGGKWRYLLWDLDWGMGLYSESNKDYLTRARYPTNANEHSAIFNSLLYNTRFKENFINRYADLINTVYQQENVKNLLYTMRDEVSPVMNRHFNKWGGSITNWNYKIDSVLVFNSGRINHARNFIQTHFNLVKQVGVDINVFPAGAGIVKINTIKPPLPWKGIYYDGVPITVSAIPEPGYVFSYWEANNHFDTNTDQALKINVTSDDKFVAHFEKLKNNIDVFPNPCDDECTLTYEIEEKGQLSIAVYSALGNKIRDIVSNTNFTDEGRGTIKLNLKDLNLVEGMYIFRFEFKDVVKNVILIRR